MAKDPAKIQARIQDLLNEINSLEEQLDECDKEYECLLQPDRAANWNEKRETCICPFCDSEAPPNKICSSCLLKVNRLIKTGLTVEKIAMNQKIAIGYITNSIGGDK